MDHTPHPHPLPEAAREAPRAWRIALALSEIPHAPFCRLAGPGDPERPAEPPPELAPAPKVASALVERAVALGRDAGRLAATAERADEEAAEIGARIVTVGEPGYPPALLDLPQPPPVLWVRGELPPTGPLPHRPAVAIVGSRRTDAYGREVAELFAHRLAGRGVCVVSGFARGIDAAAHEGALAGAPAETAATVAVLGTGLGVDYPRGHAGLGDRIAARGALLSEFPLGTPGRPWMFPVRNRLIAALAGLVLVVRAAPRSGSLVTARAALELGRDVWAVPGRIFDHRAAGTHALLADGAGLARHPSDLLEALGLGAEEEPEEAGPGTAAAAPPDDPDEAAVLAALAHEPRVTEELAAAAGLPLGTTRAALTALELAGLAHHRQGGGYALATARSLPARP